jgi:hypothetical protein
MADNMELRPPKTIGETKDVRRHLIYRVGAGEVSRRSIASQIREYIGVAILVELRNQRIVTSRITHPVMQQQHVLTALPMSRMAQYGPRRMCHDRDAPFSNWRQATTQCRARLDDR